MGSIKQLVLIILCGVTFFVGIGFGVDKAPVEMPNDESADRSPAVVAAAEAVQLGGRQVDIWRPSGTDAAPIIVFSHGFGACGRQSMFLMQALAGAGYFVVAPQHADARCKHLGPASDQALVGPPQIWSDETFRYRRDDIVAVLDALRQDPDYQGQIDWTKLGLMGHSLGGYTVLGLAGAWPGWHIPGVKAVVLLSPTCPPFLASDGKLRGVSAPVQYQGGTLDSGITPFVNRSGGCYDETPAPAQFVEFRAADHFAWNDSGHIAHVSMIFYARAFFDAWMRGKSADKFKIRRDDVSDLRIK